MAYFIGDKREENVLNVRKAVNGVRVSLIQCDDGSYTFRVEASVLKRPADFIDDYSTCCAFANIVNAYVKAASEQEEVEEPKEVNKEAAEEEETEGEG